MLAKQYKIEFLNYWVTESRFKFIPEKNLNPVQVKSIPINIDFDILKAKGQKKFKIVLMVETDQEKEYPYNFHVRSESIFHLLDRIDSEEENNLMLRVALPQAISYTRVYISNNSAYSPLKRYMLPIIDLNNLIEQKVKSFLENISVKNKTRRRKLKIK